ncbi:hypothetical protein A3Q56_07720 [Intoshia linei]|uniref:Uncharacterized protein n=1 Tax=Intoshia linei TaxID=1819745 RepID=A0A177AT65_9BILA|nr:hypothetical protein A3Q56_07720 [Intoshia linei]
MGNKESKTLLMQSDLSSKNKLESEKSPSPKSSSQTIHTCVSSYTNDQSTNNSISKAVLHTSEETLHIRPRSAEKEVETINSIIQKQTKFIKKKSNYQKPNERKNVTLPWVRIKGRKSVTFVKNDSAGLYVIKEDTRPEEVKRRKSMFSRRDSVKVKPQRDMLWTQRYPNLDEISPSIVYPNDFTKRKQYCYIMSILSVQDDMKCLIRNNLKLMEKHDSQSNNQFESNIMHPSPNKFYSLSHLFTCYIQDCELCRENAVIPDPIIKINPSIHTQMLQKFVDCTYALFNINANIRRNNLHIIHDLISNPKKIKKIVKAHVQFNLNKNLVEGEAGTFIFYFSAIFVLICLFHRWLVGYSSC